MSGRARRYITSDIKVLKYWHCAELTRLCISSVWKTTFFMISNGALILEQYVARICKQCEHIALINNGKGLPTLRVECG